MKRYIIAIFILMFATCSFGMSREELIQQAEIDFPDLQASGGLRSDQQIVFKLVLMKKYFERNQCGKALDWLDVIEKINISEYYEILGYMYANGDCIQKNIPKAIECLWVPNTPSARTSLLQIFLTNPNKKTIHPAKAFKIAEDNAKHGGLFGPLALSDFYKCGIGAIQSYPKAYIWAQVGTVACPIPGLRKLAREEVLKLSRMVPESDLGKLKEAAQHEVDKITDPQRTRRKASATSYLYTIK